MFTEQNGHVSKMVVKHENIDLDNPGSIKYLGNDIFWPK